MFSSIQEGGRIVTPTGVQLNAPLTSVQVLS
jgi:hypothetical protein